MWISNGLDVIPFYLPEPWLLTIGVLQIQCRPTGSDGVDRLAVSRGLLTCCRAHILLSSHIDGTEVNLIKVQKHAGILLCSLLRPTTSCPAFQTCLLLNGLFPVVYTLCEQKLDCLYIAFEGK